MHKWTPRWNKKVLTLIICENSKKAPSTITSARWTHSKLDWACPPPARRLHLHHRQSQPSSQTPWSSWDERSPPSVRRWSGALPWCCCCWLKLMAMTTRAWWIYDRCTRAIAHALPLEEGVCWMRLICIARSLLLFAAFVVACLCRYLWDVWVLRIVATVRMFDVVLRR